MALFFSGLFTLVNAAVRNGSIIYYFKYVVRDEARFTLYATSGFLAFIAGAALHESSSSSWATAAR